MAASDFADLIIKNLKESIGTDASKYNSSTPNSANKAISDAITDYLIKNTSINVSYSGMIPGSPPVTDPLVEDVCEITGNCSPIIGTSFSAWVASLESNIVSGFFIGKGKAGVSPISPVPAFLPGLSLNQSEIKDIHTNNLSNPQKPVWEHIASSIIKWLNSIVTTPFSAGNSNTSSTGIATPKITIVK